MGFWTGTEDKFKQLERFDPQRRQGFDQILQQALSGMQQNKADFAPIAQRETERFKTDIMPSIAQRFTSMGSQSTGSGRAEAMRRGGVDLGTQLAGMGSQHGLQQNQQLMQLLGMGLAPQQENFFMPGNQGFLGGMAPGIGEGVGQGIAGFMGGGSGGGGGGKANFIKMLMSLFGGG